MGTTLMKPRLRGADPSELTGGEQKFILELMAAKDWNLAAAVRKAYPRCKNPAQYGTKLMKRKRIAAILGKLQREDVERLELDRHEVLRQLYYALTRRAIDFVNPESGLLLLPHQLPNHVQSIIDGFEQEVEEWEDEEGNTKRRIKMKYKLTPHAVAREQGMKHKGLFQADNEQRPSASRDFLELLGKSLPLDEIEERLEQERKKGAK